MKKLLFIITALLAFEALQAQTIPTPLSSQGQSMQNNFSRRWVGINTTSFYTYSGKCEVDSFLFFLTDSSIMSRAPYTKQQVDSIAALHAGTVTSVGSGYGLQGGPITSSGTLTADTATLTTNNRADSILAVAKQIPSLSQVNGVIDLVRDYGADTTGVTNIYSALLAASATKRPIYIRKGIYNLTGLLTLPDSTYVFGDGRTSIIKLGNTNSGLKVKNVSTISGLTFKGTKNNGGASSQDAITVDSATRATISNCWFTAVKGSAVRVNEVSQSTIAGYAGVLINNCYIDSCGVGADFGVRGEYSNVIGCVITNCDTGIRMLAGNVSVTGGMIEGSTIGMYLQGATNNAHSVASGVMINHNTTNIQCNNVSLGYLFDGCMLYAGAISITNTTTGIRFSSCDISSAGVTISASNNTAFLDCRILSGVTFTIDTSKVLSTAWVNGYRVTSDLKNQTSALDRLDSNFFNHTGNNVSGHAFYTGIYAKNTPEVATPDSIIAKGDDGILQVFKNPLADGTFTPTLTDVANITSSTAHNCIYSKNDSTVTISGKIEFTTTTGGGTLTRLGISIPFASNFTADDDCSGTAFDFNDLEGAVIISDATNDRIELTYSDDTAATHIMRFTCQYRIK